MKRSEIEKIIIDSLPDATFAIDAGGMVIAWNRAMAVLTGVTPAAIMGKGDFAHALPFYRLRRPTLADLVLHPDPDLELTYPFIHRDKNGTIFGIFALPKWKSGTDIRLWGKAALLRDVDGRVIGAVESIRDMTEHELEREIIRLQTDEYHAIVEDIPALVCRFTTDGHLTFVNNAYCGYFEKTREELIGSCFFPLVFPDDRAMVEKNIALLTRDNPVVSHDNRIVLADGTVRWQHWIDRALFDQDGRIIECQSIGEDITGQKETDRKMASLLRFQTEMLETAAIWIDTIDAQGNLTSWNRAAEEISGYRKDEVLGHGKVWEYLYPDPAYRSDIFNRAMGVVNRGEHLENFETVIRNKQGETRVILWYSNSVKDDAGRPAGSIALGVDVTERKNAALAQQQSQEFLNKIINSIGDPVFVKDRQHRFVLANDAECVLAGRSREELLGKNDYDFFPKEQVDVFWEKDEAVFATGRENTNEEEITIADGSVRTIVTRKTLYVDQNGDRFIVGVIRDITGRKEAERVLADSEQRYRTLAEASPDFIFLADADGRLTYVNSVGEKFFKRKIEDIVGKRQEDLFEPAVARLHRTRLSGVFKTGKDFTMTAPEFYKKFDLWLDTRLTPIRDARGTVIAVLGLGRDITTLKRAEKEQEQLQLQLIQAEKMAGIGTLANGVAHEFNNLLQIIRGNVELGLRSKAPDEMKKSLNIVFDTSKRATRIVSDLLSFSRADSGKNEQCDATDLIESVLSITEPQLVKQKVTVVRRFKRNVWIEGNRAELQQVFFNLINNARDAMLSSGGMLTIGVRQQKGTVAIEFTDSGSGISDDALHRLFEPFFTTKGAIGKSSIPGTGLGLYVSYWIIKRHGGTIDVKSDGKSFTRFIIRLPVTVDAGGPATFGKG